MSNGKGANLFPNPSSNHRLSEVEFRGWMFASSPALNALENPVYDISVLACKNSVKQSKKSSSVEPIE